MLPAASGAPFQTRGVADGSIHRRTPKPKVVFVMGSTGTGKSKLAIDIATHLSGEVVNSDKIQLHDGLPIVTNKVTPEETAGIPHHLIGVLPPDADRTAAEFRRMASSAVAAIIARGYLPVVAGGSNRFIEELVDGDGGRFRAAYDCLFLWIDVAPAELYRSVNARVDRMVEAGLVDEVRRVFRPHDSDYSRGIRSAIGVPEMDEYLRRDEDINSTLRATALQAAIDAIKANTWKLVGRQLEKIGRLRGLPGWKMHRLDATEVFQTRGEGADETWEEVVLRPALEIVQGFLSPWNNTKEEEGCDEEDQLSFLRCD